MDTIDDDNLIAPIVHLILYMNNVLVLFWSAHSLKYLQRLHI